MNSFGIIKRTTTLFILVDLQEKFIPVINNVKQVISNTNILTKSSQILKVPLIVTEQYPEGLGHTSGLINLSNNRNLIKKISFSCFDCDDFSDEIQDVKPESIVIFGIEAHVCVLQTALDALKNNIEVYVVADAISSRTQENKNVAIERMRQSGIFIVSTEMIIFQLLDKAGTEEFKLIQKLLK